MLVVESGRRRLDDVDRGKVLGQADCSTKVLGEKAVPSQLNFRVAVPNSRDDTQRWLLRQPNYRTERCWFSSLSLKSHLPPYTEPPHSLSDES